MEKKDFNSVWLFIGQHLFSTFKDFPRPEIKILSDEIEVYFDIPGILKSIPKVGDSWRIFAQGDSIVLVYTFIFDYDRQK